MNLSMNIPISIYIITYNKANKKFLTYNFKPFFGFPQDPLLHPIVLYFYMYNTVIFRKKIENGKESSF